MKKIFILLLLLPLPVNAISVVAYEMNSKQILYENNIHEQRSVASISKIMTAVLAVESGKLDDIVTVGEEIKDGYGSNIYLKVGEQISLKDLVYGLMLRSGNDASYAIAKYVGTNVDNFIVMMNNKAKEIGMTNTIFNNPNGLDEKGGNLSTAYDMALLVSYAMNNKDYQEITKTKNHLVKTNMNYYSWKNKNKLLFNYQYTTGGKTGYTDIAKRTLVTTASNNNLDVAIVTLNDGNDFSDHKKIYEDIFKKYTGYNILKKGDISVLSNNSTQYYVKNDFKYALLDSDKDHIYIKYLLDNSKESDKVGIVKVYLDNQELSSQYVYIKHEEKVTLWQKIKNMFVNNKLKESKYFT